MTNASAILPVVSTPVAPLLGLISNQSVSGSVAGLPCILIVPIKSFNCIAIVCSPSDAPKYASPCALSLCNVALLLYVRGIIM